MGNKRDDEKAVEELLCEAMDMVILEEAAAINSISSDLETRFQVLKTFHSSTTQKPASCPTKNCNNLPRASRGKIGARKGEQQTVKKLQQYEKMVVSYPSRSSDSRRFSRWEGFWCWSNKAWGRESKEERDRNMRKMVEKARKEEEKICEQAEKLIKRVNYASAQMEPYIPN